MVLKDYHTNRLTFGVSVSSLTANMAVKQNAINFAEVYHKAASVVPTSFFENDSLTGEDSKEEATDLQKQLQALFY